MKFKKMMLCLLVSVFACGMFNMEAYAAEVAQEVETTAVVTETTTQAETKEMITETQADEVEETIEDSDNNSNIEKEEIKNTEEEVKEEVKEEVSVKKETTKKETTKKKTTKKKTTAKAKYTKSELRLLAALISCEANGEPYAGKLAVGIVVLNRKESKVFPNSIKNVIYQKYQFGPARNGSLAKALKEYDNGKFTSANEKECIKAAKAALSGTKKITYKKKSINLKGYMFFSRYVKNAKLQIAHHQFK